MTPAPYTPETVAQIRRLARHEPAEVIADQFSWDVPRLKRVARQHFIELAGDNASASSGGRSGAAAAASQIPARFPPWMTLEAIAAALPKCQGGVLRVLIAQGVDGPFMGGHFIADRVGTRLKAMQSNVRNLRINLGGTRWGIEAVNHEGYRVVKVR